MDSPDSIKKKGTINPIYKKDYKYFQYAVLSNTFSHVKSCEEIAKHSERITKVRPFINGYNWKERNFPLGKDDWKTFERNNAAIAFNVLYAKKEKYILYMFQNITRIMKKTLFFS